MMNRILVVLLALVIAAPVSAQSDRQNHTALITTALNSDNAKKADVELLLRSLVQLKGRVLIAKEDSFDFRFKTKGGTKTSKSINYDDVVYLKHKDKVISSIPSFDASPFGYWDDIKQIYPGTRIVVMLEGNRTFEGWSNSAIGDKLIVLNEKADKTVEIERKDVVAFYGMLGGYGGVKKNASKATEGMSSSGGNQLVGGALVGVAALLGMIKSDGRPILIYSK